MDLLQCNSASSWIDGNNYGNLRWIDRNIYIREGGNKKKERKKYYQATLDYTTSIFTDKKYIIMLCYDCCGMIIMCKTIIITTDIPVKILLREHQHIHVTQNQT